jgi:peroxiredoxin
VRLFGISRDSPYSHTAWDQVHGFGFPLLSDWTGECTHAFGVAHAFRGLDGVSRRSAFLVDGTGMITDAWSYGRSQIPDVEPLLAAARAVARRS